MEDVGQALHLARLAESPTKSTNWHVMAWMKRGLPSPLVGADLQTSPERPIISGQAAEARPGTFALMLDTCLASSTFSAEASSTRFRRTSNSDHSLKGSDLHPNVPIKDAPACRPVERFGGVISYPLVGGLHHQYARI